MTIDQRETLLHVLADSAALMLHSTEQLRRLPVAVDVEPLMILRHRTLLLLGKLFCRKDDSNDAELIVAVNAIVAECATAGQHTLAELQRAVAEVKHQHERDCRGIR